MEHSIGVGAIVGLVFASSLYVWNSNEFTKEQKIFLLIAMVFAPVQWLGILVIKYYNNHKFENTAERKTEKKLDSTISNLAELKEKGILTEDEYSTKVEKIKVEKIEQNLKNSLEYKQMKSLLDNGVLTKEDFESKIRLIKFNTPISHVTTKNKNYRPLINILYKFIIIPVLWFISFSFITTAFGIAIISKSGSDVISGVVITAIMGILIAPIISVKVIKLLYNNIKKYQGSFSRNEIKND